MVGGTIMANQVEKLTLVSDSMSNSPSQLDKYMRLSPTKSTVQPLENSTKLSKPHGIKQSTNQSSEKVRRWQTPVLQEKWRNKQNGRWCSNIRVKQLRCMGRQLRTLRWLFSSKTPCASLLHVRFVIAKPHVNLGASMFANIAKQLGNTSPKIVPLNCPIVWKRRRPSRRRDLSSSES